MYDKKCEIAFLQNLFTDTFFFYLIKKNIGERLIQYASENLVTEILIHPVVSTLAQCVRNLLSSFTRHRHIIHAGYTFAANGSWALQVCKPYN